MSSTRSDILMNHYDNEDSTDYEYYKNMEQAFQINIKTLGRFGTNGKYASSFHAGRIPNEYYCQPVDAMTLRSGKKLNYITDSYLGRDVSDLFNKWNGEIDGRCYSMKKFIWFCENYYYIISSAHNLHSLYKTVTLKINEFIQMIDNSPPAIYKERNFEIVDGTYIITHQEDMPTRQSSNYIFCACHYTVVKNGKKAIEQKGHHQDQYLPRLKTLLAKYSRPHRSSTETETFKLVSDRTNSDCAELIFSFIPLL